MQRGPQFLRVPAPMPYLIQQVEVDIAVERRDRRSLRDSYRRWLHLPLIGDPHGQALLDQPQHAPIHHALFDEDHQLIVRNGRKIAAEINLHHAPRPSIQVVANCLAGHLRISPWSITVRAVVKISFKDRLQHQLHRSLHHAILDRRDPKWASASLWFWDVHSPHRVKAVGLDRKSTRLNSSHANISYAVFCLKKKKTKRYTHNI